MFSSFLMMRIKTAKMLDLYLEGWYSVTPEQIAIHLASQCNAGIKVVEAL